MPISDEEWKEAAKESSANPVHSGTMKSDIAEFLNEHSDQGFSLTEIADNVDSPLGGSKGSGNVREKVKQFVTSAGEKRVVKYFLNQLVAEGHVETRIRNNGNSETVYYRSNL
jgi:hypothetical protein